MHIRRNRGGPERPRRRWPRLAVLAGVVLAVTLAVAACGGGGNNPNGVASLGGSGRATATTNAGGSSDPRQTALAYARCMRQQGIDMPDPKFDADGHMAMQLPRGVGPDDPKFKAAQQACNKYLPNGGAPEKPDPQAQQQMLAFARCMRQHGINIPDPKPGGGIDVGPEAGASPDSPKFKAAEQACQQYQPKGGKKATQSAGSGT